MSERGAGEAIANTSTPGGAPAYRPASGTVGATEGLLRATFESLGDAVFVVDAGTRTILDCNTAALRMFGYDRDALVGRSTEFLHMDRASYERFGREMFQALASEGVFRTEYRLRRRSGEVFPSEHTVTQVVGSDGCRVWVVSVVRDVAHRLQAQERVERHQAELQAIYDHAPVLMCVLDQERRVQFANRAFRQYARENGPADARGIACGVLGCLNALDHPDGCGSGPQCGSCALRLAILDTLTTGRSHSNVEHATRIGGPGAARQAVWLGATAPIPTQPKPLALLVLQDISERRQAEDALAASRSQLRALSQRIEAVREEERARIAREIHDELGQMLSGVKMDLRAIEACLEDAANAPVYNAILDKAVDASDLVDRTLAAMHRIAAELRSTVLDRLGLAMALHHEADRFRERTGIDCRVHAAESLPTPPDPVGTVLFRIAQEALTNVVRHAGAHAVDIGLEAANDEFRLEVSDDGVGISDEALSDPASLGLLGMRERAAGLGGAIAVTRGPHGGTRVAVRIPMPRGDVSASERARREVL